MIKAIDIKENSILKQNVLLLDILLKDWTTGKNIFWATDNYEHLGIPYKYSAQIFPELITGYNGEVIRPRVAKTVEEQTLRVKEKAEVFTPSWICNAQNNLVDETWFGRKNIFNRETEKNWVATTKKIEFPESKTWQEYVSLNRLEVSCGEAPYLVSRYDTITGKPINIKRRIGLLDRKLRVVSENTQTEAEWREYAFKAFKSIYAFEWQGDNLLLARENLLYTYSDYFFAKFNSYPPINDLLDIAEIISWNVWQMDALKFVVPNSCHDTTIIKEDLLESKTIVEPCKGCKTGNNKLHNGKYCYIMDWEAGKRKKFISLLKKGKK